MKIQLIRHATLKLFVNNKTILIDPMLSSKGAMTPVPNVANQSSNPLVELPINMDEIIKAETVLLTHTHRDHFDEAAVNILPKNMQLFCQPEDKTKVEEKGFSCVNSIEEKYSWNDIVFNRTGGHHGKGEDAVKMGPVSGYVITAENEPSIYISGDTVWCREVEEALAAFKPQIIICFAGAAKLSDSGTSITMDKEDILQVCRKMPDSKVIVVHMEAWNHCMLTKEELRNFLKENSLSEQVYIPNNGEVIDFDIHNIS